jgi:flagellar hook-length control protein FliK
MNINHSEVINAEAGFAAVSKSEATIASSKKTEHDTVNPLTANQGAPANTADHKIAALKHHLAAILQIMGSEKPAEELNPENTKKAQAGFAIVSGSEAAVAPQKITESDTAKPAKVAQTVPAASADHKIAALKDHLTAILQAMEPDTPVETLKTEPVKEAKAGFATVSGSEAAVAPPKKAQSDTVNPFTANHTIPTASADRHMAPIKEILKAFVQAIDHEATTLNQKSGHMTLLRPGAGNVILPAVEGELPAAGKTADGHQKTENTREAFIARVAEFLQTKDAQGRSITDMITRVRNLTDQTKTAPNAKIRNTSLPTTGAHHQETAAQGSRMETAKSVFIADSEKPAVPNNAASSMSSAQEGKLAAGHYILEDAPISAPVIFRSKHHDASTMPADRGAVTGATAVFSDLLTTDAKAAPQGARMQSLIDQIAQAKQQMDRDFGRVRITLTPPNMGTVDMDVIVRQNRVEVTLISDNASVQQLLSAHADDVKSALQRQDMKIDSFQVFLQTNQDGSQQPSNPWASMQGRGEQGNAYTPGRDETADTPPLMEEEPVPSTRGLVSIFV